MTRTNYIYIDYENVAEVDLSLIAEKPVKVILVTGPQQRKLPKEMIRWAEQGKLSLLEVETNGKNAADFVLACELGVRSAAEGEAYFHIVSKDSGFDALITHLKARKIHAARHKEFADIPIFKEAALCMDDRVKRIADILVKLQASRPTKEKKLRGFINGHFGKKLTEEEADKTIIALKKAGFLEIDAKGSVDYPRL